MPSGNSRIAEYGKATQVKKGSAGLPGAGRKPSKLKKYIKDNNMSANDYTDIFETITTKYSFNEIKKMVQSGKDGKGKDLTALVWGFMVAWLADCKKGLSSGGIYAQLTERKYGKAVQPIAADINVTAAAISPAEREAAFKQAMKDAIKKDPALLDEITGGTA